MGLDKLIFSVPRRFVTVHFMDRIFLEGMKKKTEQLQI